MYEGLHEHHGVGDEAGEMGRQRIAQVGRDHGERHARQNAHFEDLTKCEVSTEMGKGWPAKVGEDGHGGVGRVDGGRYDTRSYWQAKTSGLRCHHSDQIPTLAEYHMVSQGQPIVPIIDSAENNN